MKRIILRLKTGRYPVFVGRGLIASLSEILSLEGFSKIMVVSDSSVHELFGEVVTQSISKGKAEICEFIVEPGEGSKTIDKAIQITEALVKKTFTRSDAIIALGGGVVGDLAGFVASIYKRGINLIHIPTTLMAQVDSAIGGKTGVDLPEGKNLVGTFYHPQSVVCDIDVLSTLPERQFLSGLAEVIKYFLLRPGAFNGDLLSLASRILKREAEILERVVFCCASIKARIVEADERDEGIRAILNYGHTLGHALEAATGYSGIYTHGEAISIGMMFAALTGVSLCLSEPELPERQSRIISSFGLPVKPLDPIPDFQVLLKHILQDKKSKGTVTMVFLKKEGEPVVRGDIECETLSQSFDDLLDLF